MKKKFFNAFLGALLVTVSVLGFKASAAASQINDAAIAAYDESLNFNDYVDDFGCVPTQADIASSDVITTFTKKNLAVNGPDATSAVFLIMGDGFTKSEQDKFNNAATDLMNYLLDTEPYKSMSKSINFYAVDVISNVSGAAKDPSKLIDTYFKCTYNYDGYTDRLLYPKEYTRVFATAQYYVPEYDQIFILVNDTKYGGGGGAIACGSLDYRANEIMVHEIGHSLGKLRDEYWFAGEEAPNMTQESNPSKVRWSKFIDGKTIGVFPFEENRSWFRPSQGCKMRYLGLDHPYCKVCENEIKNAIKKLSTPSDGAIISLPSGKYVISNSSKKYVEFCAPAAGVKNVTIPSTITISSVSYKVKTIAWNAFYKNKKVTSVTVGKNITTIEDDTFSGATALKTVVFTGNVKTIGENTFRGCSSLTKVTIPNTVTSIGAYAFYGCKRLSKLTLPTALTKIGDYAFGNCTAITGIIIPSKVTKLGKNVFYKNTALATIKITTTKLTSSTLNAKTFSGVYSKVKIKVPKTKLASYKKLFKRKGLSDKVKVVSY